MSDPDVTGDRGPASSLSKHADTVIIPLHVGKVVFGAVQNDNDLPIL